MFETFRNAWKVQELRKKILYTLFILIIFRLGAAITVPYLDAAKFQTMLGAGGGIFDYFDMISGGSFKNATIFALSITPYINASIIMQLLTYALPPLERMQKEGPEGRKKLDKITRFVSLAISLFMSYAFFLTLKKSGALFYSTGFKGVFTAIIIIACFTAGSSLIVWMGDQINEKGIGNGISMILFASIVSRGPASAWGLVKQMQVGDAKSLILVPLIIVIFVLMIAFIVLMNNSERRIPIQYAKRVVGRKQFGGQSSNLPIKVAMSGVMPIIFAMSLMQLPGTLKLFVEPKIGSLYHKFLILFSSTSYFYATLYFLLIIGFNYFYVSMQYNPIEIANNLRSNNGGIPGIRPGRPTSEFISRVLSKVTLIGACFLGVIAIFPIFFSRMSGFAVSMGGTSILILVSVALETNRTLESQMMMRHHKGFLE